MSAPEMKEKFETEYPAYQPDPTLADQLKALMKDIDTTIVLGKWCSDSQLQVPRFYKVLDDAGIDGSAITVICVDEMKKATGGEIDGMGIEHVPTFIFSSANKEIGRITEAPLFTLESDMVLILENK